MRKRILSMVVALSMILSLLPVTAFAADICSYPVEGGSLTFDKSTGTVTGADRTITSAVIPKTIDGVAVKSVLSYAFQGNSQLTYIEIQADIQEIGNYMFKSCSALQTVKLPESLTKIGLQAFVDCTELSEINFPDSITEIGSQAFGGCDSLRSVTFPAGMTSTGTGFRACTGLVEVTIPSTIKTIDTDAFYYCSALETVHIASGVTKIDNRAFYLCSKLVDITIPESVTSIGQIAFSDCSSLQSIRLPSHVTEINAKTFIHCSSLKYLTIAGTITEIGRQAFLGCDALTDIYFKSSGAYEINISQDGNDQFSAAAFHYGSEGPGGDDGSGEDIPDIPIPAEKIKVEVNSPVELTLSPDGTNYDGNPFTVSVEVTNQSEEPLTIKVRPELLESGKNLLSVGPEAALRTIAPGASETFICQIQAVPQTSQIQVPYAIVLEDKTGTTKLYREACSISLPAVGGAVCTIKFDLNGGKGTTPDTQILPVGSPIKYPEQTPVKEGYIFDGWYHCYEDSFLFQKLFVDMPAEQDMTFQASWSKRSDIFQLGIDNLRFANDGADYFNSGEVQEYQIDGAAKDILLNIVCKNNDDKTSVQSHMIKKWRGSCFGMCAVPVLVMHGTLSPAYFQAGAINTYDLNAPKTSTSIRDLVNYYQLVQYTKHFKVPNKGETLKSLVDTLEKNEGPVILCIQMGVTDLATNDEIKLGGHIILAYGCEKTAAGDYYDINIWDPNDPGECHKMFIKSDFSAKMISSYDGNHYNSAGEATHHRYAEITYFAGFNETDYYDSVNLQDQLMARTQSSTVSNTWSRARTDDSNYILHTNYPEFTISCSDGTSAKVENGEKVSGNIDISDGEYLNEFKYNSEIRFRLSQLDSGKSYTITPETVTSVQTGAPIGEYVTTLSSSNAEDGFFAQAAADARGDITFWETGKIETSFNTAVGQRVVVTRNDYTTPWYIVSATSTTTGLTAAPSANEVKFSTKDSSHVTVSVADDFNQANFEKVSAGDEGVRVAESDTNKGTAVILGSDNTVQASKQLGHSVVFYSLCETSIAAQSNILSGGRAVRPAAPVRKGYTFVGWYTSPDYDTVWDFNTPITEDIQLFAKWTENTTPPGPSEPSNPDSSGGSSPDDSSPVYSISVPSGLTGGKISVTPTRASAGQRVTITATPDKGYELDSLTVTDNKGNELVLTDKGAGKYTFHMPTGKVTIHAIFKATQPLTPIWNNPFIDVAENAWYFDAVRFVNQQGLMNGTSFNTFSPDSKLTRAQLAQVLYNKSGKPYINSTTTFTDVVADAWYADAITWAASKGIISGYGNGMVGPNDFITREQLATILWRYENSPISNYALQFTDTDHISQYALNALKWAAGNGVMNGYSDGRLAPDDSANRSHVAQMLKNCFNK